MENKNMKENIKKGRAIRVEKVKVIEERLKNSKSIVLSNYRGLTVNQISILRREVAQFDTNIHVQKNKLLKIALSNKGFPEGINEFIQGPTAVAYSNGDVSGLLKALFKFPADGKLQVKGAYSDGMLMDVITAEKVSNLPTRDQLLGQLLGVMQAPVRYMAVGLNDVVVRVARTLKAVSDKKNSV